MDKSEKKGGGRLMFDFSLASFGIGSANVDTKLKQEHIQAGELLQGSVHIQGGNTSQKIDNIYLYLVTQYSKGDEIKNHIFDQFSLTNPFTIQPEEEKVIPFELQIPVDVPMSCGKYPIFIKTDLDIPMAIDPTDRDRIHILPLPIVAQLLKLIEDTGFVLYSVINQFDSEKQPHPFFQIFRFKPSGRFDGFVDQLDVIFDVTEVDIDVQFLIFRDQRALENSFYWKYAQPVDSFMMNGRHMRSDPIQTIQDFLIKE